MKKILAIAVAVLSFLNILAETEILNGIAWHYSVRDGDATLTGGESIVLSDPDDVSYEKIKGSIVIPSTLGGHTVTSIGDNAFWGCCGLTSVTVPKTIKRIGTNAFFGCTGYYLVRIITATTETGDCQTETAILPDVVTEGYWHEKTVTDACTATTIKIAEYASPIESKVEIIFLGATPENLSNAGIPTSAIIRYHSEYARENPPEELTFDFSGDKADIFNGLLCDTNGVMCGIVQIATTKKSRTGFVRVNGFVMLKDGKKQTIKTVTVPIEEGRLSIATKVGKSILTITIGGNGFTGTLGEMTVASGDVGEDTGIISGTLKMSYFDAKTSKIKTKSIKLTGITSDGEAIGDLTIKGQATKSFAAETKE